MMRKKLIAGFVSVVVAFTPLAANAKTGINVFVKPDKKIQDSFNDLIDNVGVEAELFVIKKNTQYKSVPMLKNMRSNALGFAARTENNKCFIFLREEIQTTIHGRIILEHEYAHCVSWDRYGNDILGHGREFRATCRSFAKSINSCKKIYKR